MTTHLTAFPDHVPKFCAGTVYRPGGVEEVKPPSSGKTNAVLTYEEAEGILTDLERQGIRSTVELLCYIQTLPRAKDIGRIARAASEKP